MKSLAILGSSGSIGRQALSVIDRYGDRFKVTGLSVNKNTAALDADIAKYRPDCVWVQDEKARKAYKPPRGVELLPMEEMAALSSIDLVLSAVVGISGLSSALSALRAGKALALANKEAMVTGGRILKEAEAKFGGSIIPVDSEHSAVWQALKSGQKRDVKKLIITASGGAFRGLTCEELEKVTPERALKHPVWKMGAKVTVDSATLMNKGLEVIEAMYLFDVDAGQIEVVQHRQSIIHGMAEFNDNTVIACMSRPDMRLPIQLALTYPERLESEVSSLDFAGIGQLTFEKPDTALFPCLGLAYEAAAKGESAIVALNGANEAAVDAFLSGEIAFTDIARYNSLALGIEKGRKTDSLDDILSIDKDTKQYIVDIIKGNRCK